MARVASRGLIWWLSGMAAYQSLSSAAILTEIIGLKWGGFAQAVAAALSAGTAVYVGASHPAPDAYRERPEDAPERV